MSISGRLSIVATVLAFLAIPTIASAHGGNNDPNVVHACINNVSLSVRIVGVSGSCISAPASKAETPAHWDIQGPAGAPGTNGTNGTNGIDGIDGTNGTNGTNGIDGTSVTFVDYFSGTTYAGAATGCPNGGAVYAAGNPAVNAYICNGTNGTDGTDGIDGTGATNPDPPCFDNTNRYVDCGNGTVTDTVTGLIWLQQADCLPAAQYAAANQAAAGLKDADCNLTDNSSPGDWRLPTKDDWSATVAPWCASVSGPSLTNDAGTGCAYDVTSFAGVARSRYWSSSSDLVNPDSAWYANLIDGFVSRSAKVSPLRVWPVRGGPR